MDEINEEGEKNDDSDLGDGGAGNDKAQEFENRLSLIEARNRRVEHEKAWELSYFRRVSIAVFTYLTVFAYGLAIGARQAWLNAAVAAVGFQLSTLTLPILKTRWIQRRDRVSKGRSPELTVEPRSDSDA